MIYPVCVCGKTAIIKEGKFGKFFACPDWPHQGAETCSYKAWVQYNSPPRIRRKVAPNTTQAWDVLYCERCGEDLKNCICGTLIFEQGDIDIEDPFHDYRVY